MTDVSAQAAKQIAGVEERLARSVASVAAEVESAGLTKHGDIVGHLKKSHGLTHGHANAMAHAVRRHLDGGPPAEADLLDAQYAGAKASLRPILDAVLLVGRGLGDDVTVVVQKTGVSLRRAKQFALVQAPSARRVQLGLNLDATPVGDRVQPTSGMCTHRVDLTGVGEVDDDVRSWLTAAYRRAGS